MTLVQLLPLLHLWIRHFTIIVSAGWLQTSSKLTEKKSKESTKKLGNSQLLKWLQIYPKDNAIEVLK